MKKNLSMIVLLLSSWIAFNACSSSDDDEVTLTVNPTSVSFSAEGGERDVTVVTTAKEWTVASDAEWCKVGGQTENKVTLTVDPYNELTARTAKVTVNAKGALAQVVEVRQAAAAAATLVLNPNELTEFAAKDPVAQELTIETNQAEVVVVTEGSAEWCHVTLADNKASLSVSVDPSKVEARETSFKVIAGVEPNQAELTVVVKQADGTVKIELEDKEVELNVLGVKTVVKLKADSDDWTPQLEESATWCTVEKTEDGQGLVFTAESNIGGNEREAKVTLSKDVELTVYQTGEKLEMGDFLYVNKKAVGIVINHDVSKKEVSVMALEEKKGLMWCKAECNDYVNGNVQVINYYGWEKYIKEQYPDNWKENFPVFGYCVEMDEKTGLEGWFIPASGSAVYAGGKSDNMWEKVGANLSTIKEKLEGNEECTSIDSYGYYWTRALSTTPGNAYSVRPYNVNVNNQSKRQDTNTVARCFWRYTYE